ncbi:MAG: RnfABCDGE type electron transport complex subunit D [Gammaproteobacteria bacterium]|nr:RnfABCDGE type electron transport complex subunit D [Gammaproteobacteria bacterium]
MAGLTMPRIMGLVLAALLPGIAALCYYFGLDYLPRLLFAAAVGLCVESAALALQHRPLRPALSDGSTLVTCTLITVALPPTTSLGVLAVAVVAGVALGKHVYGGLGNNPFNPAVVGYAVVLVSFPAALAAWPQPTDGLTAATALTALRHREGQTVAEIWAADPAFGAVGGYGWEWINAAFLLGGVALMVLRIAAWRVPAALLGTLALLAVVFYDSGSSRSLGSPAFHLFTGGTCLAACFFATDPVTHPATARGQWLFGALIGVVAFLVRGFGNYPDGLAFGILLANAATPYLDRRLVAAHG